ncbi:hypothetical protein M8C21_031435, partial [Ambrosia artemisiifolia]
LPHTCQVVHLPAKLSSSPGPGLNETDIVSLLSSYTSVTFNLSHSCSECRKKGRLCDTENERDVYCFDIEKAVTPGREPTPSPNQGKQVRELINILDISFSCGVSVFSYEELEDATQNFDPSHELGDGGFGAVYYDGNISTPICPESFSCPGLGSLKYPFYNGTDRKCGLIKINCTSKEIQFGGWLYEFVGKFEFNHDSDRNPNNIIIYNRTFEQLVIKNKSCEALMYNFTSPSPSPLLYSVSIFPTVTLFKCRKNLTYPQQNKPYFEKHKYNSYNSCKDHDFYYNYINGTVPSDLPHTCQVVYLPAKLSSSRGLDETNLFSLVSSYTSITFNLSKSCSKCQKEGRLCGIEKGRVQCLDVKWVKTDGEQFRIPNLERKVRERTIKILVIAGSVVFLMLSLVLFIIWRHFKRNPFSYVSTRKKSLNLEDISKLQDGRQVAVKKLYENNCNRVQQFRNEVQILTKLRHPNLVVLYGCTSKESCEFLLVYEYVPNGTVADHIHGEQANQSMLTWSVRMNIAIETASALYDSEMRPTMNEVLDVLMDIQDVGRLDTYGSTRDLQAVNALPLSETNDTAGLLKDFRPSPISVINEWQSNTSASTTLSSNGDRLSLKDNIDTYKTHGSKNDKSASIF